MSREQSRKDQLGLTQVRNVEITTCILISRLLAAGPLSQEHLHEHLHTQEDETGAFISPLLNLLNPHPPARIARCFACCGHFIGPFRGMLLGRHDILRRHDVHRKRGCPLTPPNCICISFLLLRPFSAFIGHRFSGVLLPKAASLESLNVKEVKATFQAYRARGGKSLSKEDWLMKCL